MTDGGSSPVEVLPLRGIPEVAEGDHLASLIAEALPGDDIDLRDGDVLAVTQKAVSKAEGRLVPDGERKAEWVAKEARRVVARRGGLVIAETPHGFVCANAGVDASNVAEGILSLLPEDPDASAEGIRSGLRQRTGREVGVVITDTFGRPWRRGLVNVAIGCAGLRSLRSFRSGKGLPLVDARARAPARRRASPPGTRARGRPALLRSCP